MANFLSTQWGYPLTQTTQDKSVSRPASKRGFSAELIGVDGSTQGGLRPISGFRRVYELDFYDDVNHDSTSVVTDFHPINVRIESEDYGYGFVYRALRAGSTTVTDIFLDLWISSCGDKDDLTEGWTTGNLVVENVDATKQMDVAVFGRLIYIYVEGRSPTLVYLKETDSTFTLQTVSSCSAGDAIGDPVSTSFTCLEGYELVIDTAPGPGPQPSLGSAEDSLGLFNLTALGGSGIPAKGQVTLTTTNPVGQGYWAFPHSLGGFFYPDNIFTPGELELKVNHSDASVLSFLGGGLDCPYQSGEEAGAAATTTFTFDGDTFDDDVPAATATFTFITDQDTPSGQQTITLVDGEGLSRSYVIDNDYGASDPLEFNSGATGSVAAGAFKTLVESSVGHNGSITVGVVGAAVTLTQVTKGTSGNTDIIHSSGWDALCSVAPPNTFTGGLDASITLINEVGVSKTYTLKNDYSADEAALEFNTGISAVVAATNFKILVESTGGHNGTIQVVVTSPSSPDTTVTMTQATIGTGGNTAVTYTLPWTDACSINPSNFTGGTGDLCPPSNYLDKVVPTGAFNSSSADTDRCAPGFVPIDTVAISAPVIEFDVTIDVGDCPVGVGCSDWDEVWDFPITIPNTVVFDVYFRKVVVDDVGCTHGYTQIAKGMNYSQDTKSADANFYVAYTVGKREVVAGDVDHDEGLEEYAPKASFHLNLKDTFDNCQWGPGDYQLFVVARDICCPDDQDGAEENAAGIFSGEVSGGMSWSTPAFTNTPGTEYTPDGLDPRSLEAGDYAFAYYLADSETGRRSALSEIAQVRAEDFGVEDEDGDRPSAYAAIEIVWDNTRFDQAQIYRSVRVQDAGGTFIASVLQLEKIIELDLYLGNNVLNTTTSNSNLSLFFYELEDKQLIYQEVYTDRSTFDEKMPYAGSAIAHEGSMIVSKILGSPSSSTSDIRSNDAFRAMGEIRWSSLTGLAPELFSPLNTHIPDTAQNEVIRFVSVAGTVLGFSRDRMYHIRKEFAGYASWFKIFDMHEGYGLINSRSVDVVGSSAYFLSHKGLKAVDSQGKLDDIQGLNHLFLSEWAGDAANISLSFDPVASCLFIQNYTKKQTACLWFNTAMVTQINDTDFKTVSRGVWPSDPSNSTDTLVERALFLQNPPLHDGADRGVINFKPQVFLFDHDRSKTIVNSGTTALNDTPRLTLLDGRADTVFEVSSLMVSGSMNLKDQLVQDTTKSWYGNAAQEVQIAEDWVGAYAYVIDSSDESYIGKKSQILYVRDPEIQSSSEGDATQATATFSFGTTEFDDHNDQTITLIDESGLAKTYKIKNDYGADESALEFNAGAFSSVAANNFKNVVESYAGHYGSIQVTVTAVGSNTTITMTQRAGVGGNTTILHTANWDALCSTNPPAAFTGGANFTEEPPPGQGTEDGVSTGFGLMFTDSSTSNELKGLPVGSRIAISPVYFRWVGHNLGIQNKEGQTFESVNYHRVRHVDAIATAFTDVTGWPSVSGGSNPINYKLDRFYGLVYEGTEVSPKDSADPRDRNGDPVSSMVVGESIYWAGFGKTSGFTGRFGVTGTALSPGIEVFTPDLDFRLLSVLVDGKLTASERTEIADG